ncbi:hypothetical protein M427DRAFT_56569, partial [Gonapodya prolifera JEL478]
MKYPADGPTILSAFQPKHSVASSTMVYRTRGLLPRVPEEHCMNEMSTAVLTPLCDGRSQEHLSGHLRGLSLPSLCSYGMVSLTNFTRRRCQRSRI